MTSLKFQNRSGLPGVVGIIDGTHIRLVNPPGGERDYINRKGYPSVQLQLVVDDYMLITDAYVGWPGSTHDARVLKNPPLYHEAENDNKFSQNTFILGDGAYPVRGWLQTPIRDNGDLSPQQKRFNKSLSSVRQTVGRAIGHLKGRFRRLREIYCTDVEKICNIIMTASVLHNLCILADDDILLFIEYEEDINNFQNIFQNAENGLAT
ncbi:putative nuclease HARBI1 [Saccostrea cucullata]|uniref:putative nuclease HARBI1 n=1 Tax=Saccostrea cuccullata TaxID=36930 RepID=UPI002ED20C4E